MPEMHGYYPLSEVEFDFDCLPAPIEVLVLASARHFGVLVSLVHLPKIITPEDASDPYEVLFNEVTEMFDALTLDYKEAAEENGFTLVLPEHDQSGLQMTGEVLEISGKIGAKEGPDESNKELILAGEYFFITESGVDISEFITETNAETRVLH